MRSPANLESPTNFFSIEVSFYFLGKGEQKLSYLIQEISLASKQLVEMEQVHGRKVSFLGNDDPLPVNGEKIGGVDALLTTRNDLVLAVRTADCLPILLYHPLPLIGVIHAGRKGTEAGVLRNTLQIARDTFSISEGFKLWFGPAICKDCYQIDRETDLHYDLVAENKKQIVEVFPKNGSVKLIESGGCTYHENDLYYSYRKENKTPNRNYSLISLR